LGFESQPATVKVKLVASLSRDVKPRTLSLTQVGGLDVEDPFAEPFGDELRDAGLPSAAGSGDDGRVGGFPVRNGLEDAGEVVDFGIAMLNFPRDESGAENASIADHPSLTD
jgi:hypothetical protein